jgi:hypothetical protein
MQRRLLPELASRGAVPSAAVSTATVIDLGPGAARSSRAALRLDRCAQPTVGSRRWNSYFVCGVAGYLAGVALVGALALHLGLDVVSRLTLVLAPPSAFLVAVLVTKALTGEERIVFFEKAVVAVGASSLVAWVTNRPVGATIDLTVIGVATFLAFGRVGCFRVACCHGRRCGVGVAYGDEHARAGFPARWVGHRVFPVQLVESAVSGALAIGATAAVYADAPPGVAAAIVTCGYGPCRFALELLRGDDARPYAAGVSEAQWTAAATTAIAAACVPRLWTVGAAAATVLGALVLLVARRAGLWPRLWLAAPRHVAEVAALVASFSDGATGPTVTSEGLRLSAARLPDGRLDVIVSDPGRDIAPRSVQVLVEQLGHPWARAEILAARTPGLVHAILEADTAR